METISINSDLSSANSADRRHQHYGNSTLSPAYPYSLQGQFFFSESAVLSSLGLCLGTLEKVGTVAFRSET